MVSLVLLLGCNLSYIVDLFAALHQLTSASAQITKALIIGARALKTLWSHLKLFLDIGPSSLALFSCVVLFYRALGSSRRLGGAAEHLIDGSEKHCRLSFEF